MKTLVIMLLFLFLFSSPLFAQVWTIDDEIHEVEFIIERMTRMQQQASKSSIEQAFYIKKLHVLEIRLALLQRAKDGDGLAARILLLEEERCTNLIDFSARLLGLRHVEFTRYLDQCNARLKMLGDLGKKSGEGIQ